MIILNYHKVEDKKDAEFYTVSTSRFTEHLENVRKLRLRAISTEELFDTRDFSNLMMLHFDDGTTDHFHNVAPLLKERGMKGIFFVSTSKVGKASYLTDTQLQLLTDDGHCIECHGHNHKRMDHMSPEELELEISTSVELITLWTGRAPRILAPPGGFFNQAVVDAARRHGLEITRTMRWGKVKLPLADRLDCLVVTKFTSTELVAMWLQGRGLLLTRLAYLAKQFIRFLLPIKTYLKLRRIFGTKGSKAALLLVIATGTATVLMPMSPVGAECIARLSRRTVDRPKEERDILLKYSGNATRIQHSG